MDKTTLGSVAATSSSSMSISASTGKGCCQMLGRVLTRYGLLDDESHKHDKQFAYLFMTLCPWLGVFVALARAFMLTKGVFRSEGVMEDSKKVLPIKVHHGEGQPGAFLFFAAAMSNAAYSVTLPWPW